MSEFKPKVQNTRLSRFLATGRLAHGISVLISFAFCAFSCAPLIQFQMLCFGTLSKCSFGLLWWLHWASMLPKVPPKRHNSEVQKLPSLTTVNCTPTETGTPFSLFWEVIKLHLFEHFSRSMLWDLNLTPSGFINTGLGQKMVRNGTPLKQPNWEFGPQWVN